MKAVVAALLLSLSILTAWVLFSRAHDESPDALSSPTVDDSERIDRAPTPRRLTAADSDSQLPGSAANAAEDSPPREIEITLGGVESRKNDRSNFSMSTSLGRSRVVKTTDTHGNGVFTIELPDYEYSDHDGRLPHVSFTIDHPRAERFEGTWHLDSLPRFMRDGRAIVRLAIRLSPAKTIRGVVVDETGRPIDGAVVGAYDLGDGIFPPIHENIAKASIDGRERTLLNHNRKSEVCPITDADGKFEIRVPLRERMLVAAAMTGFEDAAAAIDGSDSTMIGDLLLRLRSAVKISGRAVVAGKPFSGTIYATPIGGPNLGKYDPRAGYQGPIEVFSLNGRIVEWLGGTQRTTFTGGDCVADADGRFAFQGLADGALHDLILRPTDGDETVVADEVAYRFSKTVVAPENDLEFDVPAAILEISVKSKEFEGTVVDLILKGDARATVRVPCRPGAKQKVLWPPLGSVEISIFDPRFEMPTVFAVAPRNGEAHEIVLEPKAIGGCPQLSLTLMGEDAQKIKRVKVRWKPLDDESPDDASGASLRLSDDLFDGVEDFDGGIGYGKPYDPKVGIRIVRGIDLVTGLEQEMVTDQKSTLRRRASNSEDADRESVEHTRTFIWSKIDVADGRYLLTFSPIDNEADDGAEKIRFVDMTEIVRVAGTSISVRKVPVRGRTIEFWPQSADGRVVRARCEIAEPSGEFAKNAAPTIRASDAAHAAIETPVLPPGRRRFRITADGFSPKIVEIEPTGTSTRRIAVLLDPIE